jgi:hypothetical protein
VCADILSIIGVSIAVNVVPHEDRIPYRALCTNAAIVSAIVADVVEIGAIDDDLAIADRAVAG